MPRHSNQILVPIWLFIFMTAVAGFGAARHANEPIYFEEAMSLIKSKDFFKARDYVTAHKNDLSPFHTLILGANLDNVFNKAAASNDNIGILLTKYRKGLSDEETAALLRLKQANHGRLYEYKAAYEAITALISRYGKTFTPDVLSDDENTQKMWLALRDQPKQQIVIRGATALKMTRDKANLKNLEVSGNGFTSEFIFDTGANISTVTESMAKHFNMKVLEDTIDVGAITGIVVKSKLALCPQFTFGNIIVNNAIFLVMPDDALAIKQISFQINGILGFPVIEALHEIQLTRDDMFMVPEQPSSHSERNLALDFLNPVIDIEGDSYTFDTGATDTMLYAKYFKKYGAGIADTYQKQPLNIGGAGGASEKLGYKITFSRLIGGKRVTIPNVQLFSEEIDKDENPFYGNIGHDVINEFYKMTLNFDAMFIRFE